MGNGEKEGVGPYLALTLTLLLWAICHNLWASVFSHLYERVLAHSTNTPSSSKTLWFSFPKMQVFSDHE